MEITQEVRDDTAGLSDNERAGMAEKSKEFMDTGGEIYVSESGEKREAID